MGTEPSDGAALAGVGYPRGRSRSARDQGTAAIGQERLNSV